jgi:hydroxypyruvate isomerase
MGKGEWSLKISYMIGSDEMQGRQVLGLTGEYDHLLGLMKDLGYDGVEVIVANPFLTDFRGLEKALKKHGITLCVICTGEIFGLEKISFADSDRSVREEAVKRTKECMKIAGYLGAKVTVGRVKGGFLPGVSREDTVGWSVDGFLSCADAFPDVDILVEPVN